ncbi:MAG: hypothetical protein E6I66_03800 [Chloroflexi bacterium]|nr:MAG: hypothetical protein E6I66_03800 [Chloroflexota bacterium]
MRDPARFGVLALIVTIIALAVSTTPGDATTFAARTLDGRNNNLAHPAWGRAGTLYLRVAPTNYADGISSMATGPSMRYVSNRVFNDAGQNIFSKDGITQWGWVWGQFLDHDFGLRDERPAENAPIGFRAHACRSRNGRQHTPAAGQHPEQLHRCVERLRRRPPTSRVASRRTGRRRYVEQRRAPHADGRRLSPQRGCPRRSLDRAGDGPDGPARRNTEPCRGRGRRSREREHRPHSAAHAFRARAQPYRRVPALISIRRGAFPDRAPCGRRGDPIHHLHAVPARARGPARPLSRVRLRSESRTLERVRGRGLSGAQHDPRRVRHDRSRRHLQRRAARRLCGTAGRCGARRRPGQARDPPRCRLRHA